VYSSCHQRLGNLLGIEEPTINMAKGGWTKSANDGHPNQTGHHKWADQLFKFVKENKLCQ
jgi:hypothetical protein